MANSKAVSRASTSAASRKSASRHYRASSTGLGQISVPGSQMPATLPNEPVALMAEIDGSPILIRILVGDLPAEMQSDDGYFSAKDTDIRSVLWSALGRMTETVLRVGSLELDLIGRAAKRGNRPINLLPREFQLLRYMMRRSNQLLTRAILFKEVWHYKFVPETNLVDVHIGRLRRKIDGSDDAPMIRTVRGAGFVLSAPASLTAGIDEGMGTASSF
jgi:DNA-binding winged helix-turn-helix (wHTH) protein